MLPGVMNKNRKSCQSPFQKHLQVWIFFVPDPLEKKQLFHVNHIPPKQPILFKNLNPRISNGELYKYLVPFGDKQIPFSFLQLATCNELGPMFCWIAFSETFRVDHSDPGFEKTKPICRIC